MFQACKSSWMNRAPPSSPPDILLLLEEPLPWRPDETERQRDRQIRVPPEFKQTDKSLNEKPPQSVESQISFILLLNTAG